MTAMNGILLLHTAATFFMIGLIWFVQIDHYPLLNRVGEREFPPYEQAHCRLTGRVVGPPMLVEVGTGLLLCLHPPSAAIAGPLQAGAALLLLIGLSTALLQIPAHRELTSGFHPAAYRRLAATNWVRTVAWSLRGILVLAALAGGFPALIGK